MNNKEKLVNFVNKIIAEKDKFTADGKWDVKVEYVDCTFYLKVMPYIGSVGIAHSKLRVSADTGVVEVIPALFKESDMCIFFWLIWGFIRVANDSYEKTDLEAFDFLCAHYSSSPKVDYLCFLKNMAEVLSTNPSKLNVNRLSNMKSELEKRFPS